MKNILLILALLISIYSYSEVYVYKLKFDKQSDVVLDSTMTYVKVQPSIISYQGVDSTAVYEEGIFYDVISNKELSQLNKFIVSPYPSKFNHSFAGINETNAIFVRKE